MRPILWLLLLLPAALAEPIPAQVAAAPGDTLRDTTQSNGYTIVTMQGPRPVVRIDTTFGPRPVVRVDTIVRPDPGGVMGVPFGPTALTNAPNPQPYTWTNLSTGTPNALFDNLRWAARNRVKITLNLPGGQHSSVGPNLSMIGGKLRYDSTKYLARVKAFDRQDVRDSVAKYREWIEGINSTDEPHVVGKDDGAGAIVANTWGERGWMTKAKVDRQCQAIKAVFPGIPVGPAHAPTQFYPELPAYKHCNFIRAQYSWRMSADNRTDISAKGAREAWLAREIAAAKGLPLALSINVINGGIQDRKDGTWDCKHQGGVKGQYKPNCTPVPDSVLAYLLYFGSRTAGSLQMWRYDDGRSPRIQSKVMIAADSLQRVPYTPIPVRP